MFYAKRDPPYATPCLRNKMKSVIVISEFPQYNIQYNIQSIQKLYSTYKICFVNNFLINKERWERLMIFLRVKVSRISFEIDYVKVKVLLIFYLHEIFIVCDSLTFCSVYEKRAG